MFDPESPTEKASAYEPSGTAADRRPYRAELSKGETELQIRPAPEGVLLLEPELDLAQTLDCGQCFRFDERPDGSWHGVARHRPLTLRQTGEGVLLQSVSPAEFESFWRGYFDFGRDYAAIRESYRADRTLYTCACFSPGMRVLRQDAWEALLSFIISQNNNVKRIKGIVRRLCLAFGEPIGNADGDYAFPSPAALADRREEELAPLRAGWRASYLLDAARRVAGGEIDLGAVAAMPLAEARKALQTIRGVGPKVAECVLLYGMGRLEAFPLDVWMKRAMTQLFPGRTPESFGDCAGIAQQYIFHYCRCHPSCCRVDFSCPSVVKLQQYPQ